MLGCSWRVSSTGCASRRSRRHGTVRWPTRCGRRKPKCWRFSTRLQRRPATRRARGLPRRPWRSRPPPRRPPPLRPAPRRRRPPCPPCAMPRARRGPPSSAPVRRGRLWRLKSSARRTLGLRPRSGTRRRPPTMRMPAAAPTRMPARRSGTRPRRHGSNASSKAIRNGSPRPKPGSRRRKRCCGRPTRRFIARPGPPPRRSRTIVRPPRRAAPRSLARTGHRRRSRGRRRILRGLRRPSCRPGAVPKPPPGSHGARPNSISRDRHFPRPSGSRTRRRSRCGPPGPR